MGKCREAIYNSEIEATVVQRITEGTRPYINQIYTNSNGFKWCINAKGYYHIYRIEPCKADGKICYIIQHYRLKPNGMLADAGYKLYITYDEAKTAFEQL